MILRITQKNFCLYDAQGEKISLTALMKEAEEKHMEWIDVFGYCKYKGKTGFVRVIAHRLLDGQVAKARKRKTRKASKNQHRMDYGCYIPWRRIQRRRNPPPVQEPLAGGAFVSTFQAEFLDPYHKSRKQRLS